MDVAKVLPDIIRLTEEAARANLTSLEHLRSALEEEPQESSEVGGFMLMPDDVVHWAGMWRRCSMVQSCMPGCRKIWLDGQDGPVHVGRSDSFRVRPACPAECKGDIHRWPCTEAEAICEGLEWERGA